MRKLAIIIIWFLGTSSGIVVGQKIFPKPDPVKVVLSEPVVEKIPAKPVYLNIPKLGLSGTIVESVGLDSEGKMDVPKDPNNVGWFDLGYIPTETGNAVLAGHYDKVTGEPAVFYNLSLLEIGDTIDVNNEDGEVKVFRVINKQVYSSDSFPTEFVFGKSNKKMLNLITCNGTWDSVNKNYSNRLVVFTELVE